MKAKPKWIAEIVVKKWRAFLTFEHCEQSSDIPGHPQFFPI